MLLKLVPAPPAPTIHFSLNFADLPPTLPSPSTWTAQISHLMLEDIRPPETIHSLDRAVGIASLLDEVSFDIEHSLVRCRFVDGSIEEWGFDTNTADQPGGLWTLMRALEEISRDVKESTIEDEKFTREERERELAEREREKAERGILTKTPSLSRKPSSRWRDRGHKKQRSFFMQFVSNCVGSIIHLTSPNSSNHPSGPASGNGLTFQQTSFPTTPSPTSSSFHAPPPHSAPPVLQSHPTLPEVPNTACSVASSTTSYPASPFLISLPSPHKGQIPITPQVPGTSPLARALRRSARSALVDAYRLFVLEELKKRFPVPTISRLQDASEKGLPNAMGFGSEPEVVGNPNEAWHAESRTNSLANKKSAFMIWTLHSSRWRALQRMRDILVETDSVRSDAQINAAGNHLSDAELQQLGPDAWVVNWSLVDVEVIRDVTGAPMAISVVDRRGSQKLADQGPRPLLPSEQSSPHQVSSAVVLSGFSPAPSSLAEGSVAQDESKPRFSVDSGNGFEATTMNVPESFSDDDSSTNESHHEGGIVPPPTAAEDNQTLETVSDGSSLHTPTSASHEHQVLIIAPENAEAPNNKDLPAIPELATLLSTKMEAHVPSRAHALCSVHMLPRFALQEYTDLQALRGRLAHLIAFSASQDRIIREELQNRFQVLAVRSRRRAWSSIGWGLSRQGSGKERSHWKAQLNSCYGLAAPFRSSPLARYSWTASDASTVPFPSEDTLESTSIETLEVGEDFSDEGVKTLGAPVSRQASASSTTSEVSSIFSQETASLNTEATSIDIPLSDEMFILGDDDDEDEDDCQSLDYEDLEDLREHEQPWEPAAPVFRPNVTETIHGPVSPSRPPKSRNALSMALAKVKARALPSLGGRPVGGLLPGLAAVTEEPEMEVNVHDVPEDVESWRISQRRKRTKMMRQKRERIDLYDMEGRSSHAMPVQRAKREMTFMGCDEVAVEGDEDNGEYELDDDLEMGLRPSFTPYVRVRTGPSVPASWTQDTLGQDSLLYQPLSSSPGTTPASSMPSTPILRTIDVAARPCTPPPLSPPLSRNFSGSHYYSGRKSDEFESQGSTFEYEMAGYGHFTSPHPQSAIQSELIKEFTLSIDLPQRQRVLRPSLSSGSSPKVNFAPLPSRTYTVPASPPTDLQKMRRRRMDREKAETLEMIFAPGPGKDVADLCAVQGI